MFAPTLWCLIAPTLWCLCSPWSVAPFAAFPSTTYSGQLKRPEGHPQIQLCNGAQTKLPNSSGAELALVKISGKGCLLARRGRDQSDQSGNPRKINQAAQERSIRQPEKTDRMRWLRSFLLITGEILSCEAQWVNRRICQTYMGAISTQTIEKFKSGREILSAGESNMNRSQRGVRGCS